jgi:hypothetical protein
MILGEGEVIVSVTLNNNQTKKAQEIAAALH